MSMFNQLSR